MLLLLLSAGGNAGAQDQGEGAKQPFCPAGLDIPARPPVDVELGEGDIYINADQIDVVEEGVSQLKGNAELTADNRQVRADEVLYNQAENNAVLSGDVKFWDESVFLSSESAYIEFENDTGRFKTADYRLLDNRSRGRAESLFIDPGKLTTGKNADYTTCEPEDGKWDFEKNVWKISASELTLNHETDRGAGKNIVLRIKDVPVFYSPYFTFPLSKKRKSGLLMPGIGTSGNNGFETQLPYYWNIAPNMDATITPRLFTDNGVMGLFEYRYLFDKSEGRLNLEYLPGDDQFNNRDRSLIEFEHNQRFLKRGRLSLTYNRISDRQYFEDFGAQLADTSTRYLPRQADLRYRGNNWKLSVRAQGYQVIDRNINVTSRPYKTLPQVRFNYSPLSGNNKINFNLDSEVTYFDRTDETGIINDVAGFRTDLYPSVSYPLKSRGAFLIPKIGVRHTQYNLTEKGREGVFGSSPDRTLPILSIDSGIFLERAARIDENDYLHTLEPRLHYLYVPDEDQSDLPVFDTAIFDLDYDALFGENRFAGVDRIGDANQITLAIGSRLISQKTGRQAAFFRVAQSYFLADQDVIRQTLNAKGEIRDDGAPNEDLLSPFAAETGITIFNDWTLSGEMRWNPNDKTTGKMALKAQYRPANNKVINLAYRVRRGASGRVRRNPIDIEQTDLSFNWPLAKQWSVVGRWNYAVPENRSIDMFAGIQFESCCVGIRAVGRRYLTNLDGDFNTGFFLQFELKGLAGIGGRTVDFLHQAIPGYEPGP